MRREGRFRLARRLRHCNCGTGHCIQYAQKPAEEGIAYCNECAESSDAEDVEDVAGITPGRPNVPLGWDNSDNFRPYDQGWEQRYHGMDVRSKCRAGNPKGAKRCFGHRYFLNCKRCSMCKPGRHHGHGGCKARKKIRGKDSKAEWDAIISESRIAVLRPPVDECAPPFPKFMLQLAQEPPLQSLGEPITLIDWIPEKYSRQIFQARESVMHCKSRSRSKRKRRVAIYGKASLSSLDTCEWIVIGGRFAPLLENA